MVADGVHILLAVALVALLWRTDRVEVYLVAVLTAGAPDLDRYLFLPFVYAGYLSGPMWSHRGITHSLTALLLVVALAWRVGQGPSAAIGYGSHLAADFLTGGIRLFAPFSAQPYGLYYDWTTGNVVAGALALLVVTADLLVRLRREEGHDDAGRRFAGSESPGDGELWKRFR